MNREQMLFTTVVLKLNQGTNPKTGCYRSEPDEESGAFFGTFLAKQKSTNDGLIILSSMSVYRLTELQ